MVNDLVLTDTSHKKDPFKVFISYRLEPDAPVANYLKRLIEGSIEPQPAVFMASGGGLKPSNVGYKMQLQYAAKTSHAFVAIITNASKDREWIFFEAGAAWGRDLFYAPVLVGASPEDLPSTIADYQAISGESKEQMHRLITSLAELGSAAVKPHFGQRFQAFSKNIEQYSRGGGSSENSSADSDFLRAYTLATDGDIERSAELFQVLENRAGDMEERTFIKVMALRALRKPKELRAALDDFPAELKMTSEFNYICALEAEHPNAKIDLLQRAVSIGGGRAALQAALSLAKIWAQLGKQESSVDTLVFLIFTHVQDKFAEEAASVIVSITPTWQPIEHLMVCFAGLSGVESRGYRQISDLAATNNWTAIQLFASFKSDALEETGNTANHKGIALKSVGLRSLAFNSFSRAVDLGVSVARLNMAQIVSFGGTPAAGIALLNDHQGPFDAADFGYPHQLRAELETAHQAETKMERQYLVNAEHRFRALWAISGKALAARRGGRASMTGILEASTVRVVVTNGIPTSASNSYGSIFPIVGLRPFEDHLFAIFVGLAIVLIVATPTEVEGAVVSMVTEPPTLEWLAWKPISSVDVSSLPQVGGSSEASVAVVVDTDAGMAI